jgi:phosphoglycerate dehydrogenase-like enzyme
VVNSLSFLPLKHQKHKIPPNGFFFMKLLLTGSYSYTTDQLELLAGLGYQISLLPDERVTDGLDVADFEVVVCNNLFNHMNIGEFKNLKFVQLTSAGKDKIPVEHLKKTGIQLETARGVYSDPIAEWIVLKILEICKKSRYFYNAQQQKQWIKERNLIELSGKTAAIIGYGSIGIETARRLQGFKMHITAVDSRLPDAGDMQWINSMEKPKNIDMVLAEHDIIILTLPLTPKTRHMINGRRLDLMKDDAILVNVSRGSIIDELALIAALQHNRFTGVALDVFEEEPLPADNPLWKFDNVLVTPHNAFVSDHTRQRMFDLIYKNLITYSKERQYEIHSHFA